MDWLTRILRKVLGWRTDESAEHLPHIIKGQEPYSTRIDFNARDEKAIHSMDRRHAQFFQQEDK